MSLSVCVLIGACSPVTTAPCVKKNVEYSVEAPEPVVGISSIESPPLEGEKMPLYQVLS